MSTEHGKEWLSWGFEPVEVPVQPVPETTPLEQNWRSGPAVPVNGHGVAFQNVSFVDGAVEINGVLDSGGHASIGRIDLRYQGEDLRFRRGTNPAPAGAVQGDSATGE
jgi:hypothetical protein